jgi:hypothetical protein
MSPDYMTTSILFVKGMGSRGILHYQSSSFIQFYHLRIKGTLFQVLFDNDLPSNSIWLKTRKDKIKNCNSQIA